MDKFVTPQHLWRLSVVGLLVSIYMTIYKLTENNASVSRAVCRSSCKWEPAANFRTSAPAGNKFIIRPHSIQLQKLPGAGADLHQQESSEARLHAPMRQVGRTLVTR